MLARIYTIKPQLHKKYHHQQISLYTASFYAYCYYMIDIVLLRLKFNLIIFLTDFITHTAASTCSVMLNQTFLDHYLNYV